MQHVGSVFASPSCASTKNATVNQSNIPFRPIQVKCGKRTSSGLNSPGASTLMAVSAYASTSSHPIALDTCWRSKNTTVGSSKLACLAYLRLPHRDSFHHWYTCIHTDPLKYPWTKHPSLPSMSAS